MPSKQTRRSISVSGEVYDRLKEYCEDANATMSGTVENLIRTFLGMPERELHVARPIKAPVPEAPTPKKEAPVVASKPKVVRPAEAIPSADPLVSPEDSSRRRALIQEVAESRVSVFTF